MLDEAPKTYLANVNIPDEDAKVRFQYELIKRFPDLSVVDIGRTISQVLAVAASVIGPVQAAAWVSGAMSFFILLIVITTTGTIAYISSTCVLNLRGASRKL